MRTVLTLKFGGQGEEAGQVYDYVQTLMEEMIIDRGEELLVSQVEKIEYVGRFGTPTNSPALKLSMMTKRSLQRALYALGQSSRGHRLFCCC